MDKKWNWKEAKSLSSWMKRMLPTQFGVGTSGRSKAIWTFFTGEVFEKEGTAFFILQTERCRYCEGVSLLKVIVMLVTENAATQMSAKNMFTVLYTLPSLCFSL